MFRIFGLLDREYFLGTTAPQKCKHCGHVNPFQILRITTYFAVFSIPLIPFGSEYGAVCPDCDQGYQMEKQKAQDAITHRPI